MKQSSTVFRNLKTERIILILIVTNALFWGFGKLLNVYSSPVVGAIFELLWLPALIGLFVLPILAIILWIKEKFNFKSLNLYSALIALMTIIVTIFFSN